MRNFLRASVVSVCMLGLLGVPSAFAVNRDILALQAQVQQLQTMIVTMQQSGDERYAVMHNLLQQTAASVAKVTASVEGLQKAAHDEQGVQGNSLQQLSGQMQSMNDSLDELRARLDKLDRTLAGVHQQQQTLTAGQPIPGDQSGTTPLSNPADQTSQTAQQTGQSSVPGAVQTQAAPAPQAPPLDQLYQSAISDYNAAKYNLSSQEFADVIKFYPQTKEAGNSQFYLGEIDYRSGNYKSAIDNYSATISQYPGNSKSATALLRKAQSELALQQRDNGIRDLRALINRYPQTPEAMQARSKLNGMGVRIHEKPTAAHQAN